MIRLDLFKAITKRLKEPRKFIQVIAGPRQVGKTTLALQVQKELDFPSHYASADEPGLQDKSWIEQQWDIARILAKDSKKGCLIILDEIQKLPLWSNTVKYLWDSDTRNKIPLKVLLLGSSPLLIERGLSESLAGRFEVINTRHWSFPEMQKAFGWDINQYIFYGGYPGSAPIIKDHERWRNYIKQSLIETTISRDILLMQRIDKPALLRQLFFLGCEYSSQILSFQKMQGQLQDAGNTTTLAHYLTLLEGAGMITGLQKHSGAEVRSRSSSPKLQVLNTALITAHSNLSLKSTRKDPETWGRLVESAIGAHLINSAFGTGIKVEYWRARNLEVDFVISNETSLTAIEVKSGKKKVAMPGLEEFGKVFKPKRKLLVGAQGISIDEFLSKPASYWV